ncbi:hypothetical protein BH24BAC1_BH24BAC1_31160 [soil metagenome]
MKISFFVSPTLLYLFLFIPSLHASESPFLLSKMREMYPKASAKEEVGRKFYDQMASYRGTNAVVLGYQAVSEAVMAKFVWSPYQKLRHLRNAQKIFQQALSTDPRNPEVRFLRYTVEYSVPRYLKMSEHLAEDREMVVDHLLRYPNSKVDPEGFRLMSAFMMKENHLSASEKAVITRKLAGKH